MKIPPTQSVDCSDPTCPVSIKVRQSRNSTQQVVRGWDRHTHVLHYAHQNESKGDAGYDGFHHGRTHLSRKRRYGSSYSSNSHVDLPRPLFYRSILTISEDFSGAVGEENEGKTLAAIMAKPGRICQPCFTAAFRRKLLGFWAGEG